MLENGMIVGWREERELKMNWQEEGERIDRYYEDYIYDKMMQEEEDE